MNTKPIAFATIGCITALTSAGGLSLIGSFDPAEGGAMNSIGYSESAQEIFVHFNFNVSYHVYATDGTFLRTIPKPAPGGNDDDIEFANVAVNINGTVVPTGTVLVIENDAEPPRITAVNPLDGTVLAEQAFDGGLIGSWTGGAYSTARGTFFNTDWVGDLIQEVDAADGSILNEFTIRPAGSPAWDFFFSDLDILGSNGTLYLVSDSQTTIRSMSPDGEWGGDFEVASLGVTGMSGIAIDDSTGEAWVSSGNGNVYRLGGFPPPGCVIADLALPLGVLDLADVGGFVSAFLANDPVADLAAPFLVFDLSDITAFINAFIAGCP